jgi:hypothetical protein
MNHQTWMLLLSLYAAPGTDPSLMVMPGVYTQRECVSIKRLMERDHLAGIATKDEDAIPLFAKVNCLPLRAAKRR